jgi:hypothetical protein
VKRALLWLLGLSIAAVACLFLAIFATIVPGLLILVIIGGIFAVAVIVTVIIGKILELVVGRFEERQ